MCMSACVSMYNKECEMALGNAKERLVSTCHGLVVGYVTEW